MYYLELDNKLHYRRQLDYAEQSYHDIRIDGVETKFQDIIQGSSMKEYEVWRETLRILMINLKRDTLLVKLSYTYEWECHTQRGELGSAHYVSTLSNIFNQIAQMLEIQEPRLQTSNQPSDQIQLILPSITFSALAWCFINTLVTGSQQKVIYLGNYNSLYDYEYEKPLLTQRFMRWILEDYGMLRGEVWSWSKIYE